MVTTERPNHRTNNRVNLVQVCSWNSTTKQTFAIITVIIIIDIVTIIHLCPHPPLILFGDSQSFQRRPLDGAARTHFQIPLLSGF